MALPPGPTRSPLLQTLAWIRRPLVFLDECHSRFGNRFTIRFVGNRSYVILGSSTDIKALYATSPDAFHSANRSMRPFLGEQSLLVLEGAEHRRHRKSILPLFRRERLVEYCEEIRDITYQDMERWPSGRPFPIVERMREITLDVILHSIFGVHDAARVIELRGLIKQMTEGAAAALAFLPFLQRDLGRWSPYGRFLRLRRAFDALLLEQIKESRASPEKREDFLSRLMAAGQEPMTDQELLDELVTMLAAGHETSTAALAWTFQWILADPAVHQRVRQEVQGVLAGKPLGRDHVDRLTFLDACFAESLRLSPVFPIVPRLLRQDTAVGDLQLPAGTFVAACAPLAHRDPAVFPQPDQFRPERFLGKRFEPSQYFPFGGGGRLCVGNHFAFYESTVILAAIFSRVQLRRPDTRPQATGRHGITLTPVGGTPVIVIAEPRP
jgi:cytochrome P450 family 110